MMNWLDKLLGSAAATPQAPVAAGTPWTDALQASLAHVRKSTKYAWKDGFFERVFDAVVTEDAPSLQAETAQLKWLCECPEMQFAFYDVFADVPAAPALRWARLLAAGFASGGSQWGLALPDGSHWAEALMLHATGESPNSFSWHSGKRKHARYRASQLEAMAVAAGLEPWSLLDASLDAPPANDYGAMRARKLIARAPDFADHLARHVEHARRAAARPEAAQRLHVIELLEPALPATLEALGPELAAMATSSSKLVRQAVSPLLERAGEAPIGPLKRCAVEAAPEQRGFALRLLMQHARQRADDALAGFARATAQADKAKTVQALLAEWDDAAARAEPAPAATGFAPPAIDWSAEASRVEPAVLDAFSRGLRADIAKVNAQRRALHTEHVKQYPDWELHLVPEFTPADEQALRDALATPGPVPQRDGDYPQAAVQIGERGVKAARAMPPVAVFKLFGFFGLCTDRDGELSHWASQAFEATHAACGRPTLIELGGMLEASGGRAEVLFESWSRRWSRPFASNWPVADVWPYFAHHAARLERLLVDPQQASYAFDRGGLFRAIATLPRPSPGIVDAVFAIALGSAKTERLLAQDAIAAHPGKEARIVAALADGKAEVRAVAAQWLGRLKHAGALAALETAVAKEKNDLTKGALLDALQAIGQPVEKYIDRAALAKEAPKALAKGLPADLAWFPWNALPAVHWADDGQPVPPDVLRWLLAQAVKQKSPEPNAMLRKLCALFEPAGREAFGQFVLEVWLREDVRPNSPDEAHAAALKQAQQVHQSMASYPQYFANDPNFGKTIEQLTAAWLPGFLRQPSGSAIGSKGLLAVVAACARERAAGPVQRYLKEWYGTRAAQGKALIAMLAWIEHPSATQLMLAVGNRFRTKSFQEEAAKQAEALAERKGWSLAELADRTMPSAGLDDDGTLGLSYGTRSFTARLLPDFKLELLNPEGKKIAALPEPRQDDDAAAAQAARKALATAKKELKSIVELQTDRLYEALCTQRDWVAADWQAYLMGHPVVRRLAQRLVWCERDGEGRVLRSFRPLDDGTLTDRADEPVLLAEDARVGVVHGSLLPDEDGAAWLRHLSDYEIAPLFVQFGKQRFTLASEYADDEQLKDFEGHLVETFALRGRAGKLGWLRGPAEDGGWFHVYQKRFAALGLEATIEFTGNPLPETNRTVALIALSFARSGANGAGARLPLGEVPPVLLAECRDDLRLMAADGPGFDPEWEKKSEYR